MKTASLPKADLRPEPAYTADVLLVQGEDPWQDPTGGIVTMTQNLLRAFGDRIAVAAPCDKPLPIGAWSIRPFESVTPFFFNLGPLHLERGKKPVVPAKFQVLRLVRRHMHSLHLTGPSNLLIDSAEALFCAQQFSWASVCFFFHGLNNPVARSRYAWARLFGYPYQWLLLRSLRKIKPDAIVAAADRQTVQTFCEDHSRSLRGSIVHSFPTRVDRSIFFPEPRDSARRELNLDRESLILVSCGRLSQDKGWLLLLETLQVLGRTAGDVRLIFVGDGEDRSRILRKATGMGIEAQVTISGLLPQKLVRRYLSAADVCVFASYAEGWSLAMLEALACAKPLVSTNVSGATKMIRDGRNGFVVEGRDPERFAAAILAARGLPNASSSSTEIASRYSVDRLASDLGHLWQPLATPHPGNKERPAK